MSSGRKPRLVDQNKIERAKDVKGLTIPFSPENVERALVVVVRVDSQFLFSELVLGCIQIKMEPDEDEMAKYDDLA